MHLYGLSKKVGHLFRKKFIWELFCLSQKCQVRKPAEFCTHLHSSLIFLTEV